MLVDRETMGKHLQKNGWLADHDVDDFYGLHTDDGTLVVRDTAPWSVLHERVHDGGVTDKYIGRWITEALTEAVSEHLHNQQGLPWQPTYNEYRDVLEREVLPRLGITAVELARIVVKAKPRPDRYIASGLAADPALHTIGYKRLLKVVCRGSGDEPRALLELLKTEQPHRSR